MNYCKRCLQPDTRPGIRFDEKGVCPACNYFETLKEVDWDERRKEIDEIVAFGKANNHSGYDCIIGVSGGKDSTRQALFVKEVLKMNPLLVCLSYPPEQVSQRGVENISNLIKHGFDYITIQPGPVVWRKLMEKGFYEYTNMFKSPELALFSSVPRLAIAYQIPLIWWGENAALQLGDLNVMGKSGSDGNSLRNMNTLGGGDITWLINEDIKKNQILQYCYPSEKEMEDANLKITFLGYFWKDWSALNNSIYSTLRGLEIRTHSPFEIGDYLPSNALDDDWSKLNQTIKYLKFGFGITTDVMNEEIRIGRISREEAIRLVKLFDGRCSDKIFEDFCSYLKITPGDFWNHVDKSVNELLFEKIKPGKYIPKFEVGIGL